MAQEGRLVLAMEKTLEKLSGRRGESPAHHASIDPITGLPDR
jgi:hypothetical protein